MRREWAFEKSSIVEGVVVGTRLRVARRIFDLGVTADGSIAALHAIGRNHGAFLSGFDTGASQPTFCLSKRRCGSSEEGDQ